MKLFDVAVSRGILGQQFLFGSAEMLQTLMGR